jgi:hypothetical protein
MHLHGVVLIEHTENFTFLPLLKMKLYLRLGTTPKIRTEHIEVKDKSIVRAGLISLWLYKENNKLRD